MINGSGPKKSLDLNQANPDRLCTVCADRYYSSMVQRQKLATLDITMRG